MNMHIESVAVASKDAHPRGSDAVAHSAAAAAAAAGSAAAAALVAAASSLPDASLAQELAAVKQRIADVETEIEEAKENRKARVPGDDLWKEYSSEIKQLRDEKALLLKEKEQLRDELKRKELALEHINVASPGQSVTAPRLLFPPSAPLLTVL